MLRSKTNKLERAHACALNECTFKIGEPISSTRGKASSQLDSTAFAHFTKTSRVKLMVICWLAQPNKKSHPKSPKQCRWNQKPVNSQSRGVHIQIGCKQVLKWSPTQKSGIASEGWSHQQGGATQPLCSSQSTGREKGCFVRGKCRVGVILNL